MKRLFSVLLCLVMLLSNPISAFAERDPNIDSDGDLGHGSNDNIWSGGDGVRATIIQDSDNIPVSTPIDFSNQNNNNIFIHFGKVNKISYRSKGLTPYNGNYHSIKLSNTMPRIISTNNVTANIKMIRNYFCREGTMRAIATATGFNYEDLISGSYKILLEPIAYFKYNGIMFAMTATEAALYNKQVAGDLRSQMVSLTHKNLPLAMFLEVPDLGFPAWSGSTTEKQNDDTIIAQLGLGIVRFSEPDPEPSGETEVTYRCDIDVITSILLSTISEKTPEDPAYATFIINERTYSHSDIYIPKDGSQLAWVKWRTPSEPEEITILIRSNCSINTNSITA